MNHDHDDDDAAWAELSALYRQADTPEPPSALDARLLAAARRETARKPPKPRWLTPLALAASLVLAVSLVTVMRQETLYEPLPTAVAPEAARVQEPPAERARMMDNVRSLAPAAPQPAPVPAPAPAPAAQMAAEPAAILESAVPDPAVWLAEIATLRAQGALEAAEQQLREFRRQYPDYPLPPELTP